MRDKNRSRRGLGRNKEEADLSHARSDQLATIQSDSITTSRTVPGQIVISVLRTKRVLKLIRFSAPILRDDASVNSRLCSNITLQHAHDRFQPKLFSGVLFLTKTSLCILCVVFEIFSLGCCEFCCQHQCDCLPEKDPSTMCQVNH